MDFDEKQGLENGFLINENHIGDKGMDMNDNHSVFRRWREGGFLIKWFMSYIFFELQKWFSYK